MLVATSPGLSAAGLRTLQHKLQRYKRRKVKEGKQEQLDPTEHLCTDNTTVNTVSTGQLHDDTLTQFKRYLSRNL